MDGRQRTGSGSKRTKPPSRGGPGYVLWQFGVPEELHAEVKRLASEQRRTMTQQVIWLMQQAVRHERAGSRRASDADAQDEQTTGARGAA